MTNFVGCVLMRAWFGSNRMVLPPTQHEIQWQFVRGMLPQHVISRFGDVEWAPRSPNLSACDLLLWGYLKEVYAHRPHTIQELKDCIREEIQGIPVNMLRKVMDNVRQRAEMRLTANGAHLSDIIFKK
jgi:enoyl-CoA hydratase/carnithine racemase